MNTDSIIDLLQIMLLMLSIVVVMLTTAFKRNHGLINALTQSGLLAALIVYGFISPVLPLQITPLLMIDQYSLFFSSLIIAGAIAVAALAYPYFENHHEQNEEFYILLLIATLGAVVLASSNHFISFVIGLETLGLCLYVMIAYPVHTKQSAKFPLEASLKYLILSGATSAIMLFGIALVYAELGTLAFPEIPEAFAKQGTVFDPIIVLGLMMIIAGVGFKLSLVPFHMWTPDVYEGAPVPVTAYVATISKAAMLAITLRLLLASNSLEVGQITMAFTIMAIASMVLGNLLALRQNNIKRLFAYSSIAHMGYLLVAVISAAVLIQTELSIEAVNFYIAAYFVTSIAGFAVISALSNAGKELDDISDYQGLFWRSPWLGSVMIVVLLSLAGIPLTAGFMGKFYLFSTGVEAELWLLLSLLIITSSIGLYYYLRLIYTILQSPDDKLSNDPAASPLPFSLHLVLAVMVGAIIFLGVYPTPVIQTLQDLALALSGS